MSGADAHDGNKRTRTVSAASLAAFFLLLAARGGKFFPAALAGDSIALASAGLFLWLRGGVFRGNASILPPLLFSAFLQAASVPGSGCLEGSLLTLSRFWTAAAVSFLWNEAWSPFHRQLFEGAVLSVALVQASFWMGGAILGKPVPLLLPGNPQYGALWVCLAALGVAARRASPRRLFLAAFLACGVIFSSVRSAEAALAAGGVCLLYRWKGGRGGAAGILALAALITALPTTWLGGVLKAFDASAWKRWDLWATAWEGIRRKPWLGWGPGQFEALYRLHPRPQDAALLRFDHSTLFAHNDYLQLAAASGLPALACLLWLLAALWRSCPPARRGPQAFLAACAVFSLTNFPFALPVNAFLAGAAAAQSLPETPERRGPLMRAGGKAMALFFMALALFLASRLPTSLEPAPPDRAFYGRSSAALAAAEELLSRPGGEREAERLIRGSLRFSPGRAEGWRDLALALGRRDPGGAEAAMRRALALHPADAVWWLDLALLEESRGGLPEARESLHRALRVEPRFAAAAFHLGRLMRRGGEPVKARRWLERLASRRAGGAGLLVAPLAPDALSPYARTVLAWDAEALDGEILRCRTDGKDIIPAK